MAELSEMKVYDIPMSEILADEEWNCRGPIAPIDVVDLVRSIEANGLQAPVVVQNIENENHPEGLKYRLIAGYRRFMAHRVLMRNFIPATQVVGLDELQARKMNLEENLKRKDLNMLQEARAIKHFKIASWTENDVARELGVSKGWVQVRYCVLQLPPEIQAEVAAGFLTQQQIKQLSSLKQPQQIEAVKKIKRAKILGEKGEKVSLAIRPHNPLSRTRREKHEIFKMMEIIREVFGASLTTRVLAWAAGEISDYELYKDIQRESGETWQIPADVVAAVKTRMASPVVV